MSITPPDPGLAMQLAKTSRYDPSTGGFLRMTPITGEGETRWLYPEGGRAWIATCRPERRVSPETYAILRDGAACDRVPNGIRLPSGEVYLLVDDGFEARAEPA